MASVVKFTQGAVYNQLRHNLRQIAHSGNPDIDPARLRQDYVLSPDRGMSDYDYFRERLSQLYVYGRDDVKVMAGWVVTAPQDLEQEQYDDFFLAVYDFLENRYGEENVIQAVVHDDEGGQPHLHFCFIPVVEDSPVGERLPLAAVCTAHNSAAWRCKPRNTGLVSSLRAGKTRRARIIVADAPRCCGHGHWCCTTAGMPMLGLALALRA